ncbi:putative transcription factor WRKY family [Helianthus annuus]|nr:putative transcription factor WRKY family [Helianthus annuus]
MESSSWPESLPSNRIKAIQELKDGHILTDKLREVHGRPEKIESDLEAVNNVVIQILGMFDSTLSILRSSSLNGSHHNPNDMRCINDWDAKKPGNFGERTKKSTTRLNTKTGWKKNRTNISTVTHITSTFIDDEYAWRKYGQKVILNSKYQRNYYRCSYKFEQGCQATKQVQMIDDELPKYKITYCGHHTCNNLQRSQIVVEAPSPSDNSVLISFETNALMEKNKVGTCFSSVKHTHKEGFPSLDHLNYEHVSSFDYHSSCGSIAGLSQVSSEPMSMIPRLYCEGMVLPRVFPSTCSSTHGYKIDAKIENHDYGDFHF